MSRKQPSKKLTFGKYKGKTLDWLKQNDFGYYTWAKENISWFDDWLKDAQPSKPARKKGGRKLGVSLHRYLIERLDVLNKEETKAPRVKKNPHIEDDDTAPWDDPKIPY